MIYRRWKAKSGRGGRRNWEGGNGEEEVVVVMVMLKAESNRDELSMHAVRQAKLITYDVGVWAKITRRLHNQALL
jgi:hypothetical protein